MRVPQNSVTTSSSPILLRCTSSSPSPKPPLSLSSFSLSTNTLFFLFSTPSFSLSYSPPLTPTISRQQPTTMKCSNSLVGILNFVTFLLSIPILGGGIWLAHKATTDCEKYLEKPVIALGVFLLVVSLAGFIGACCRVNWLLWFYLVVMFILIVILFCFTIFAFVVTNKGAGQVVSHRGYKEYKLGDYSNWLQKRVDNSKNWNRIRSCLIDGKVCQKLSQETSTGANEFFAKHLSPIESGCCKPPEDCQFTYVSPTSWTKNGNVTSNNPDCSAWNNNPNTLCYDCTSCKAGFLQNLKGDWKRVAVINIVFLVFLIIVYSIGCCAFRNNRWDSADPWKPYR